MNSNQTENDTRGLSSKLSNSIGWLYEPSNSIKDRAHRRMAGLLASVILILLIASVLNAFFGATIPKLVLVVLLLFAYILSRTRYFYLAGLTTTILLSIPSYLGIYNIINFSTSQSVHSRIAWITLPMILSSLFLPTWGVAIYGIVNFVGILFLPGIIPNLEMKLVYSSLGFIGTLTFLFVVTMRNRDNLEKLRQESLQRINVELEERVNVRTAQLQASNDELKAFSYSISHDLRAPLRAIQGFNRIVMENHADGLDEGGKAHLYKVEVAAVKMNSLIDDMLSLAQIGHASLNIEPIDMGKLTQEIFDECYSGVQDRGIDINIHPTPPMMADNRLMEILLTNLISNAIKFTQNSHPAVIEFGYEENEDNGYYYIRDNGVGFDLKYTEKLFVPFQRLHSTEEFEGNGIGLAIVKRIIRHHNGEIWVDSEVGNGTTFYFSSGTI